MWRLIERGISFEDKHMTQPNETNNNAVEATAFAAGGAVAGGVVASTVGGMGLAVGGTAIGIGAAPVVAAGAVVGLAAYGLKQALGSSKTTESKSVQQQISDNLKANLEEFSLKKLREDQRARDEYWRQRDKRKR